MADFAVVQQAASTSLGTQDFTSTGFGTPKGALFFLTYGTVGGTAVTEAMLSVGATDGTRSKANAGRADTGTTTTTSHESTTKPVITLLATSGAIDGAAEFSSWITDGVRINWTDAPPSAYLVTCVLLGGNGVSNVYVDSFNTGAVIGSGDDITEPGFTPDIVFIGTNGANFSFNDSANSNFDCCYGICVNDGSATQRGLSWRAGQTFNPSQSVSVLTTNRIARSASAGAGGTEIQCQDFDANGFSLIVRSSAVGWEGWYMAIKLSGISAKLLTSDSPTGTGSHSITGAGFTPQFGLMLHSAVTAVDTITTDVNAEVLGISAFTSSAQGCSAVWAEDNVNPHDNESVTDAKPVFLRRGAADFQVATLTSFDSDGCTFNYTTANVAATARKRAVLFIQESVSQITGAVGAATLTGVASRMDLAMTTRTTIRGQN
jgi:hypothetical protein